MKSRALLVTLIAVGSVQSAACSSSQSVAPSDAGAADAAVDVLAPPPIPRTKSEAELAPQRKACAFKAGAWPAETVGTDFKLGADIPIKHVIVIIQENRSFDNYLGRLVAKGYYKDGEVDVPPPGWSNPDGNGGTVVPHPDDQFCFGANHGWRDMHDDANGGKNDGFVVNNNPGGQKSFYYEDDTVIPFYYALASTFAIGDRYFAPVLTSTWPNRLFAMSATSFGIGDNSFVTIDKADAYAPNIFLSLEAGGHTWKDYTDGPHQQLFFPAFGFRPETRAHYGSMKCDLLRDIQNDTLPDVSYVMGDEVNGTSDEGPSALPGIGGKLVEGLVRALFASPSWKSTAVFITYDENGGMADHVPPEAACPPDDYPPHDGNGNALPGAFDTTGFRVPFIVVSPYAKKHFVSHAVYDHASIVRFIEARFGLPALTKRDANATPVMDLFDFDAPPFMTPPDIAATTTVDPAVLARCNQKMAPLGCAN